MARVAVVGVGSIGGYFAVRAWEAGHDVLACVRTPFDVLRLDSGSGPVVATPTVLTEPAAAAPVDHVLLATKAHQTAAAADWLRALVGPGTSVAVLQNGIEHRERVAPLVPGGTAVVPTVVYCGAELLAPGHVRHVSYGHLVVPSDPAARALGTVFDDPATVRPTDDFPTAAWRKLLSNAAVNPLTAITGRRLEVMADPGVSELARLIMLEVAATARASGADVPDTFAAATLERQRTLPVDQGTSMLFDRLAGRPTEHEAITGAVVRRAAALGVPAPVNAMVLSLVRALAPVA